MKGLHPPFTPPFCAALNKEYNISSFATLRDLNRLYPPRYRCSCCKSYGFVVTLKHAIWWWLLYLRKSVRRYQKKWLEHLERWYEDGIPKLIYQWDVDRIQGVVDARDVQQKGETGYAKLLMTDDTKSFRAQFISMFMADLNNKFSGLAPIITSYCH
jgi:hypothetical protein